MCTYAVVLRQKSTPEWWWGHGMEQHDIRKGVYWRCVVDRQESCKFTLVVKDEATVEPNVGYVNLLIIAISIFGVDFCLARSTTKDNVRASACGTSNKYRLPRFFLCPFL
jgi:hypothetical protein